ncbi:hypothetical protein EDC01DRAFT_321795, partial [Geopyxis carbonaria]
MLDRTTGHWYSAIHHHVTHLIPPECAVTTRARLPLPRSSVRLTAMRPTFDAAATGFFLAPLGAKMIAELEERPKAPRPSTPVLAELSGISIKMPVAELESPTTTDEDSISNDLKILQSAITFLETEPSFPDAQDIFDDENLSGGWWQLYNAPPELALLEEEYPDEIVEEVQNLEAMVQEIMTNSFSYDEDSPGQETFTDAVEEPNYGIQELPAAGSSQTPLGVSSTSTDDRRTRMLSHLPSLSITSVDSGSSSGSNHSDGPAELETPLTSTTPSVTGLTVNIRRVSTNNTFSSRSSRRSSSAKSEIVSAGVMMTISPYYSQLPKNSRLASDKQKKTREGPKPISGIKKFLKERKAESECSSCMEDHRNTKLTTLPCMHKYCATCLQTLIQTAMSDSTLFPPRCCLEPIPVRTCTAILSRTDGATLKLKLRESLVPAGDRIYCPAPTCAAWIPPPRLHSTDQAFPCPTCRTGICRHCKQRAHPLDTECPEDSGLRAVLDEAERQGWRRCYRCHALVELTIGCMHMKCRCKAEFCYVCGDRWKTCRCTGEELADVQRARREAVDPPASLRLVSAEEDDNDLQRALELSRIEARERENAEQARIAAEVAAAAAAEAAAARDAELLALELAQLRTRTRAAIASRYHTLYTQLNTLHASQRAALATRHAAQLAAVRAGCIDTRRALVATLKQRESALAALQARQQEEEDEFWFSLEAHLRGKPNREARAQALGGRLRARHGEEVEALRGSAEWREGAGVGV